MLKKFSPIQFHTCGHTSLNILSGPRDIPPLISLELTLRQHHLHEIAHSRVGFDVEEHWIKTKFRTRIGHSKKALKSSSEYIATSSLERDCMEGECIKKLEDDKLQELEIAAKEWFEMVHGNELMQDRSEMQRGNDFLKKSKVLLCPHSFVPSEPRRPWW